MLPTILIAEDDPTIVKPLKEELENNGFRVLVAVNGQMAIRMAQAQKPELIIMDVSMPITTGITAYKAIRNIPETARIPIIFLTSLPSAEVYPTVEQGSRVAHLKKPVDLVDLISMVNEYLRKYPKS